MGSIYNLQNKVNHNNSTVYFSFIRDIIRWRTVAEEEIFVYQCNLYSVIFIIFIKNTNIVYCVDVY